MGLFDAIKLMIEQFLNPTHLLSGLFSYEVMEPVLWLMVIGIFVIGYSQNPKKPEDDGLVVAFALMVLISSRAIAPVAIIIVILLLKICFAISALLLGRMILTRPKVFATALLIFLPISFVLTWQHELLFATGLVLVLLSALSFALWVNRGGNYDDETRLLIAIVFFGFIFIGSVIQVDGVVIRLVEYRKLGSSHDLFGVAIVTAQLIQAFGSFAFPVAFGIGIISGLSSLSVKRN